MKDIKELIPKEDSRETIYEEMTIGNRIIKSVPMVYDSMSDSKVIKNHVIERIDELLKDTDDLEITYK